MKTFIYGASDDLVEIDGAISEEWNGEITDILGVFFKASDKTEGYIKYNDFGQWKIKILKQGSLFEKLVQAVGDDEDHSDIDALEFPSYSDVLVFSEGIDWVIVEDETYRLAHRYEI